MSHATFRDILHDLGHSEPTTSCAAARYTLDDSTQRRFKLSRSNAPSLRRMGTKGHRARSTKA